MKKIIFIVILLFSLSNTKITSTQVEYIKNAKSGILIEEKTKEILYQKNIHEKLPPASMTKIMTMLLVFEAIENKTIDFNTKLITSEYASSMGGTQVYLKVGEVITVDEAIKCVAIASANDCAVLLAESIYGSEQEFVKHMNLKAKSLNCTNTNFTDCTGLNEDNHYTTSYDLSLISTELTTKYPKVFEYTSLKEDYIRKDTTSPFWLVNTNKLIGKVEGILGLKTGHTSFAGYCITIYFKTNNITVLSIVFGYDTAIKRNTESLELLKYGANNYKAITLLNKNQTLEEIEHILYQENIKIKIIDDITIISKKLDKNNYTYSYSVNIKEENSKLIIKENDISILEVDNISIIKSNKKNFFELFLSLFLKIYI